MMSPIAETNSHETTIRQVNRMFKLFGMNALTFEDSRGSEQV